MPIVVISEEPDFVITVLIPVTGAAVVVGGGAERNRQSEHEYFIIVTISITFTCFACLCGCRSDSAGFTRLDSSLAIAS